VARFSAQTSILFLHAIGQFQSESIAREGDVPKLLIPCKNELLATPQAETRCYASVHW